MPSERSARPASSASTRAARSFSQQGRWGKFASLALFLILSLIAVQCVRLGLAGILVQSALSEVETWTPASRKPGMAQVRRAAKFFSDSLEYASANPWSLEGLGAMDLARMRVSTIPREALAITRSAHARFRQALSLRPTSPFLWANLALTKLYVNEFDEEMSTALRHADELGPWEPTVQQTIVFVGLAAWQYLDPDMRQTLARSIERGAKRDTRKMFEIVKSYTRFDLVCAIEQYRLIAGSDCANAAQASPNGESTKKE